MLDIDRAGPPSVFNQGVRVEAVHGLVDSPRNYNCSILEHGGRRLMAYRSHRMDKHGRCGVVLAELDGTEAVANHWIELPARTGGEHHEDPRLFLFRGHVHLCYVESRFHSGRPYTCAIKYCRLVRDKKGWRAMDVMQPRYGANDGLHQEKNWQFFDDDGKLRAIYEAEPHTILELEGERVVSVAKSPKGMTAWPWGTVRGGTPPVRLEHNLWLTFFHSATWYPEPPHWRRYYAGAYVFEGGPSWQIMLMSQEPLLTGSAEDGHAYDPRQIDSWKPFVVFPCGMIKQAGTWLVSYGINDHMSVLAEHVELKLGRPDFSQWAPRYFRTDNASLPLQVATDDRNANWLHWHPAGPVVAGARAGVMKAGNPRLAMMLEELAPAVEEISEATYRGMGGK